MIDKELLAVVFTLAWVVYFLSLFGLKKRETPAEMESFGKLFKLSLCSCIGLLVIFSVYYRTH